MQTLPPPVPAAPLPEGRFSGREAFQQLVRDAFASAAREGWAEIILSEDARIGDFSRQETAPQRAVWDKAHPQLAAGVENTGLRLAGPQRVFRLHGGNRMHLAGPAQRLG